MHAAFITYYIPDNLSPRTMESLLTGKTEYVNTSHDKSREDIEQLFQKALDYMNNIKKKKAEILAYAQPS